MTTTRNLNQFSSNRAVLSIEKIPNASVQIQSFNVPTITVGEAIQSSPILNIPHPGDKIEFEDLMIEFALDENLEAWIEIQKWMLSLVGLNSQNPYQKNNVSDGKIVTYSSHGNPILTLSFHDLWPTNMSEIAITEEDSESVIKKISVVFKYTLYEVA